MRNLFQRGLKPGGPGAALDRRSFLKASAAVGLGVAGTAGIAGAIGGRAFAQTPTITATHGAGFCNLNLFLAHELGTVADEGVNLQLITTPTFADEITMIAAGQIDVGVMPYTTFLALYDAGVDVKIIGGGGLGGVGLVAQAGITEPADFRGKTIGTFQLDTLEIMAYDWLKMHGVDYRDLTVRYFDTTPDTATAFLSGALDIVTTIEPYGTILVRDRAGAVMLSDGTDVYGSPLYADCILGVRAGLLEENPDGVRGLIKGMMEAQLVAEQDPDGTLERLLGSYYRTDMERGRIAMAKQPAVVDARNQQQFILDRGQTLMEMGYIRSAPDASVFDFSFLEQVIAENPALFDQLRYKSA